MATAFYWAQQKEASGKLLEDSHPVMRDILKPFFQAYDKAAVLKGRLAACLELSHTNDGHTTAADATADGPLPRQEAPA